MEVIIASIFSSIIIFITVFYMIKAFIFAYKRDEIPLRKFIVFSISSTIIGILIALVFPLGYQKIINYIYRLIFL
ncbi:hypothetical protein B5V89_18795 [Heyndrickxia sporothermodurans]|nr:hypothetical protein B5V89_18795 [Heyndrickxia sporothermodurans]